MVWVANCVKDSAHAFSGPTSGSIPAPWHGSPPGAGFFSEGASMRYRVRNWDRFQHYKRRNPPWIKLHVELLASRDWVTLSDASRVLAIACMLLASKNDGEIDWDPEYIKRVAYLNSCPDLNPLLECGFLEPLQSDAGVPQADASTVQARHKQMRTNAEPETETEVETDREDHEDKDHLLSQAKERWNELAERFGFGKIDSLTDSRLEEVEGRIADSGFPDCWPDIVNRVEGSRWLQGLIEDREGKPFRLTFDWLFGNATNWAKVIEGNYSDNGNQKRNRTPQTQVYSCPACRTSFRSGATEDVKCGTCGGQVERIDNSSAGRQRVG